MSIEESVRSVIEPLGEIEEVEIVDVEHKGATLRITVDQSPDGIGTEALARITRAISRAMDEHDPVAGRYTLEISSPGLERPLRTPDHFRRAQGEIIKFKTSVEIQGRRRFQGELVEVTDTDVLMDLDEPLATDDSPAPDDAPDAATDATSDLQRFDYDIIDKARTVFEWGPTPKPGSPEAKSKAKKDAKKKQKKQQSDQEQQSDPAAVGNEPHDEDNSDTGHESENTGAVGS